MMIEANAPAANIVTGITSHDCLTVITPNAISTAQ